MSEIASEPTEFYFDVQNGQLLVGRLAVDAHIESGAHPADIARLADLLIQRSRIPVGTYPPMETHRPTSWPDDEIKADISWLHNVIRQSYPAKRVDRLAIKNAYSLDLIIGGESKITSSPSYPTLTQLFSELEIEKSYQKGLYEDWDFDDCLEYVKEKAQMMMGQGKKPFKVLFRQLAHSGAGPSPTALHAITGQTISGLLELVGHPDVSSWQDPQFIEWGVNFMLANDGKPPLREDLRRLSARNVAPGSAIVARRYGMRRYKQLLKPHYEARAAQLAEQASTLRRYTHLTFLVDRQPDTPLGHARALRDIARYKILDGLPFKIPDKYKPLLSLVQDQAQFIECLSDYSRKTPAVIKSLLRNSGELYNAWPMNDYLQNLRVA